jgi:hypothetical protein
MKNLTAEQKAKKAAYDKAYRAKKKAQTQMEAFRIPTEDKFEKSFDYPVRLYRNLKMEKENSYCAAAGALLSFVQIKNENNKIVYRVKRTGRRTFYTTSNELIAK